MLVKVFGAAVQGINATPITIEVNCTKGIKFFLVGLPDTSVKESHKRIISAIQVSGYKFPRQQIVINMSRRHPERGIGLRPSFGNRDIGLLRDH